MAKIDDYLLEKYGFSISALNVTFEQKEYRKGTVLIDYGEYEKFIYFIEEGIVEMGITDMKRDYIIDFLFPSEMFCSFVSYRNNVPSDVNLKCTTNCRLIKFRIDDFFGSSSLDVKHFVNEEIIRYFLKRTQREKEFFLLTAKERYLSLLKHNSRVIASIPLFKVASYLKITPESLSRIRKEIS